MLDIRAQSALSPVAFREASQILGQTESGGFGATPVLVFDSGKTALSLDIPETVLPGLAPQNTKRADPRHGLMDQTRGEDWQPFARGRGIVTKNCVRPGTPSKRCSNASRCLQAPRNTFVFGSRIAKTTLQSVNATTTALRRQTPARVRAVLADHIAIDGVARPPRIRAPWRDSLSRRVRLPRCRPRLAGPAHRSDRATSLAWRNKRPAWCHRGRNGPVPALPLPGGRPP